MSSSYRITIVIIIILLNLDLALQVTALRNRFFSLASFSSKVTVQPSCGKRINYDKIHQPHHYNHNQKIYNILHLNWNDNLISPQEILFFKTISVPIFSYLLFYKPIERTTRVLDKVAELLRIGESQKLLSDIAEEDDEQ